MISFRLIAGLALSLAAFSSAQAADSYPARPIRLIATFGPGSSIDIIARLVAKPLGEQLGQPVIVENKSGAGGDLGTDLVAKSAKDGYTIGFASAGPITVNPNARSRMPYDPLKDLTPIALVATGPNVILVNASIPVTNLKELIAYIKANPNKVNYASAGVGTSGHIVAWYGIVAPAGTPQAILDRLHDEIVKAVNTPETQEKFASLGVVPSTDSRAVFGKRMADEYVRFKELFKQINLVMD